MNDKRGVLVSVIIAVYNGQTYIRKCIESFLKQSYENIEIILIDDGSIDDSGLICDEIALRESCVRVIHQKNSGVSCARNVGINESNGKYLLFADQDDYAERNHIEELVKGIEENDAQLSTCGYKRLSGDKMTPFSYPRETICKADKEMYRRLCLELSGCYLWIKLFDADIVKSNKLEFLRDIQPGEDILFVADYMRYVEKTAFVDNESYIYVDSTISVMNAKKSKSDYNNLSLQVQGWRKMIEKTEHGSVLYECCAIQLYESCCRLAYEIKKYNHSYENAELREAFANTERIFLFTKMIPVRTKLRYILLRKNYKLFDFMQRLKMAV